MKRYPWLKLIKKSRPEPELEPPFWLGNHSNGEYFHDQTPRDRLLRQLILERAADGARRHGVDRRQFLASSMGMATSLAVINYVAGCSSKSNGSASAGPGSGTNGGATGMASGAAGQSPGTTRSGNIGVGSGGSLGAGTNGMGASGGGSGETAAKGGNSSAGSSGMSAGRSGSSAGSAAHMGPAPSGQGGGGVGGVFTTGDPMDPECTAAMMLDPSQEFVFDLQTHHIDRIGNDSYTNFFNLGYPAQAGCGKGLPGCFLQDQYIDLMFVQSHTSMAMLSAVPAVERELPITNPEMAASRDHINMLAHSQRVVIQGQVLPNNGLSAQLDGMDRLVSEEKVICWKVHTEWGPANVWGNAPDGFWLDDMSIGIPFIEKARKTGVKTFCCHKGLPAPLFNADHCSPRDIGPVAKMFPDTNWVVYHSSYGFGASVFGSSEGAYRDGSMNGIDALITVMKASGIGPNQNIYAEIGGVWNQIMTDPTVAAHVIGKLLLYVGQDNLLWGSDAIWTSKPQPYVDAFWNFEITPQFQMQYGYPALTKDLKRKVLGLNSAKLFNIDVNARRCAIQRSAMAAFKRDIEGELGPLYWMGRRPLGPTTRREFAQLGKLREFLKVPG
jgi:predicted TIM-barrel fold metal-dependent hydrolase